jgi:hypothetical protein
LRRLFSIVEELIERAFKRVSQLLEGFDRRDRVTVFDSRNVAAEKPRSFFDVALRELFRLTHRAESVANDHAELLHSGTRWTSYAVGEDELSRDRLSLSPITMALIYFVCGLPPPICPRIAQLDDQSIYRIPYSLY